MPTIPLVRLPVKSLFLLENYLHMNDCFSFTSKPVFHDSSISHQIDPVSHDKYMYIHISEQAARTKQSVQVPEFEGTDSSPDS